MSGRWKIRGVTLVELALVLVIMGLALGMYYSRMQDIAAERRWADAETQLLAIHRGVVNYAAKNKTAQRRVNVTYQGTASTVMVSDVLPAGRPILPCPDVNGDGLEDRQNRGALPPPEDALEIVVQGDAGAPAAVIDSNDLLAHGNCILQKGALPWRSLPGVFRETDPWGNRYTYRVDANFSNRLLGFDEHTRADSYDARHPWTERDGSIRPWPQKHPRTEGEMPEREFPLYDPLSFALPSPVRVNERPSVVCGRAPCPPVFDGNNPIVAGRLAEEVGAVVTLITWQRFAAGGPPARVLRTYEGPAQDPPLPPFEYEIVEGLPFVALSHGSEDRGARLEAQKTPEGLGGMFMAAPFNLWRASDVNNALDFGLGQVPPGPRVGYDEVLSVGEFAVLDPTVREQNWASLFRGRLMDNGFVQPRGVRVVQHNLHSEDATGVHDDVVTWMTMEDLSQAAYRARALPAPPLPPFGILRD